MDIKKKRGLTSKSKMPTVDIEIKLCGFKVSNTKVLSSDQIYDNCVAEDINEQFITELLNEHFTALHINEQFIN